MFVVMLHKFHTFKAQQQGINFLILCIYFTLEMQDFKDCGLVKS